MLTTLDIQLNYRLKTYNSTLNSLLLNVKKIKDSLDCCALVNKD